MGSKESKASDNPHVSNDTSYSTDDEAYEEWAYSATPWNIPTRQEHTELNHVLAYIVRKQLPDYTVIRMLGQCEPINDLTRLCQHLCMDGAAQRLSGEIQTFDFNHTDLEELFYNLDWHLCSKSVINSFYESCGFTEPYPPLHKQGTKIFRSLSRKWTRRCERFGPTATAKYLGKREETSALYLFLFQNDWFASVTLHYLQCKQYLPQPKNSFWWQVFQQDLELYNKVLDIEGHPRSTTGFDAGSVEPSA